jgi:hypothetical protein
MIFSRKPKAIVGLMTNSNPLKFVGRYVDSDGDSVIDTITSEYQRLSYTPRELGEFLMKQHWQVLAGKKFDVAAGDDAPTGFGDMIDTPNIKRIKYLTEESPLWIADYIYLLSLGAKAFFVYVNLGSDLSLERKVDLASPQSTD